MAAFLRLLGAVALVVSLSFVGSSEAEASGPMGRGFGIGLSLGNPTSLTGKYYLAGGDAVDFHVGSYSVYNRRYYGNTLFIGADYLFEVWQFVNNSTLKMPFYAGPGAMILAGYGDRGYRWGNRPYYRADFGLGARFPIGTALQFNKAPFEVYLEMAPSLAFLFYEDGYYDGRYYDTDVRVRLDILNFAIGARFYF